MYMCTYSSFYMLAFFSEPRLAQKMANDELERQRDKRENVNGRKGNASVRSREKESKTGTVNNVGEGKTIQVLDELHFI